MSPHHIGYLVADMQTSMTHWQTFGYNLVYEVFDIPDQKVKVCFLKNKASDLLLELVQPYDDNSPLHRMMSKGTRFYHLGFKVKDIGKEMADLNAKGYQFITSFFSSAFENKQCAFYLSSELALIELIQE